jgi:type IV pilus assembly protein PilA
MNPKNLRPGIFVLLMMVAGCAKQEDKPATPAPEPPKPPAIELVKASEQSRHFMAVSRQLELGGTLYGYVDVDGDSEKVADKLQQLFQQMARTQPMLQPLARQNFGEIVHLTGLDDIKAFGVSSVPEGNGFFRNRTFLYLPEGRRGLLAAVGGKAGPFTHLNLAPADADVYGEAEVDLPVLYRTIKEIVAKVSGEPASVQLDDKLKTAGENIALSVLDLIYGLKGHVAMVVRLDPQQNVRLPVPPVPLQVPAFSLLECIDGVGQVVEPMLAKTAAMTMTRVGNRHVYEFTQPIPVEGLRPVLVVDGTTLYFATSMAFFTQCVEQKTGLAQVGEFQAALKQTGEEGNALLYVHPRFFSRIQQIEQLNPGLPDQTKLLMHLLVENAVPPSQPLISVRTNLPDGILIRSHWDRSLKKDLAVLAMYNPVTVGLMAAMAIPAFQKVRQASEQKAVLNNLRQFAAAGDQFCLENGVNRATYADLVGPDKYIKMLNPVAGETYHALIYIQGRALRVRLVSGQVVEYRP